MNYKYFAFISYSSKDKKWGKWFQENIEHYRLPTSVKKKHDLPKEIKVFRDETDLNQVSILSPELKKALDNSRYLVVICSPTSARKTCWVNDEIDYFLEKRPKESVVLIIVDGQPNTNDDRECLPERFRNLPKKEQLLAGDINKYGEKKILVHAMARLLGIEFDWMWDRFKRCQRISQIIMLFIIFVFTLLISIAFFLFSTFDFTVDLYEQDNHFLEYWGSEIVIEYDGKTENRILEKANYKAIFENIHPKYRFSKVRLLFYSEGYYLIDTILPFKKKYQIPIIRDDTFENVEGYVYDFLTDKRIRNALVIINQKHEIKTDSLGYFSFKIPLIDQRVKGCIYVLKDGYDEVCYENTQITRNSSAIPMIKISDINEL